MDNFIIIVLLIIVLANVGLWMLLEKRNKIKGSDGWYSRQKERDEAKRRNRQE